MNVSSFIAKRVAFSHQHSFSNFIIKLATAATALSVAAMILTVAFVNGFQQTVGSKIFNFWGHLRISEYEPDKSLVAEDTPIPPNDTVVQILKSTTGVIQVQSVATKSAVIEKNKEIEGVLFKGVDSNYNFNNLSSFLVSGTWPNLNDSFYSKEILISKPVADELLINANDTISIFFIAPETNSASVRKLKVSGIYKTGIGEFDGSMAIGDIRLLRRIYKWQHNEIGAYEIFLNDYKNIDSVNRIIAEQKQLPGIWRSQSIREVYPFIFDWLNIQDVNRNVVFVVMSIVAVINLITCLLILVLERTKMVGILKATGSPNWTIQQIFLYHAAIISGRGILIGMIAGVGIALLQQYTGFIKMDETAYYVRTAPVELVWWHVALICLGTLIVCFIALLLPTLFVRSIKPVSAIQFK